MRIGYYNFDDAMKLSHPVTPRSITTPIKSLCNDLVPNAQPIFLSVTPVSNAKISDCFVVVKQQIAKHGGTACYGWQIWELPSVFIEAEFHAVWRSPDDQLEDITPKNVPIQRILFLPDPNRIYEGCQIANERRSLSQNPVVIGYFKVWDAEFELMNRGSRAYQHGDIVLNLDERREYDEIQRQKAVLQSKLLPLVPEIGRNDPCWCGSGKKLKKCHSK